MYSHETVMESREKVYSDGGNMDVINLVPAGAEYVLDIGCGDGSCARVLAQRGCIVDGITLSEKEKEYAKQNMRQVYVHNAENGLPFEGNDMYDAVICSHVLEHICYPQQLMKDIHRVLKTGGVLIVALPNLMQYRSRWELLKGNFNYEETGTWDYTHVRWYTYDTAQKLLNNHHFKIDIATVTGDLPLNSILKKIFSAGVSKKIYSGLIKISKGFFGCQLLYRAVKN